VTKRPGDGQIHTDSVTKLITVLIYMNAAWESPKGRLRLLRSATDVQDVVAEVPPDEGTLLAFRNQPNAFHGFETFEGRGGLFNSTGCETMPWSARTNASQGQRVF